MSLLLNELNSFLADRHSKLRDIWISKISKSGKPTRIDALSWLSRATLDIIGVAGMSLPNIKKSHGGVVEHLRFQL